MTPVPASTRWIARLHFLTRCRLSRFRRAQRGTVAALFALMLVPVMLASGAAVDFARLEILKASLQSVTDAAALAGASALCLSNGSTDATTVATDYFNKGAARLATLATIGAPTVTIPSTIEVTVQATATLHYSLMGLAGKTLTVSVNASAEGPAYEIKVTNGVFASSAYDSDSIYFYTVASSGTVPTSTSAMTLLFTNDPSVDPNYKTDNASGKAVQIGLNDSVGFALVNKTGGLTGYGSNGYGAKQGSSHIFYSSVVAPSSAAYPTTQGTYYTGISTTTTTSKNGKKTTTTTCTKTAITGTVASYATTASTSCYPHPCTEVTGKTVLQNNLLVGASCSTSTTAIQTCEQLYNNPVSFAWNDMGGGSDDYDYNDATYTVSCVPSSTSTQPNSVILVH